MVERQPDPPKLEHKKHLNHKIIHVIKKLLVFYPTTHTELDLLGKLQKCNHAYSLVKITVGALTYWLSHWPVCVGQIDFFSLDHINLSCSTCQLINFVTYRIESIRVFYNIARTLVLCKSYWAVMNKIFMYARPCSIKWCVQFHFSCKISFEFSARSFCLSFGNVKIILSNPNPTSSLWLLPGKDVYLNVSILTLFGYVLSVSARVKRAPF